MQVVIGRMKAKALQYGQHVFYRAFSHALPPQRPVASADLLFIHNSRNRVDAFSFLRWYRRRFNLQQCPHIGAVYSQPINDTDL
ncbi:hypothetical protein D3C77_407530 [compost metagenome]